MVSCEENKWGSVAPAEERTKSERSCGDSELLRECGTSFGDLQEQGCLEVLSEVACVLWQLWKHRNSLVFEGKGNDIKKIWSDGIALANDYSRLNHIDSASHTMPGNRSAIQ
ncbi:hypothetical protein LIER_15465 [Lithospermum erythrorhizon]|uniref:Uncharacterized protein n=1 Tax=Lithospermum erythrorhizon TaxID=34254 RepID=A0AAV3Q340_LITER